MTETQLQIEHLRTLQESYNDLADNIDELYTSMENNYAQQLANIIG